MGPLTDFKILEVAGIGPAPFAAMLLADMGADVLRLERPQAPGANAVPIDPLLRGRARVPIDLKAPEAVEAVLALCEGADALVEGFRPGVMERLGLGPDACLARNPRLVYGRMTGWGQEGPLANAAGHDINYIALSGALHAIGRAGDKPLPPLNLVGDFGGGGMLLAFGVVVALLERTRSGSGQVVDAAMVDGSSLLMTMFHGFAAMGAFSNDRGCNLLDSGAPFYDTYETADREYIAVGALEPRFYEELVARLGLSAAELPPQMSRDDWPALRQRFAALFKQKTRAQWCALLEGTDACFAPVLSLREAPGHPHIQARHGFIALEGVTQPAPAPRFSRTAPDAPRAPLRPGQDTTEALLRFGLPHEHIARLRARGLIA